MIGSQVVDSGVLTLEPDRSRRAPAAGAPSALRDFPKPPGGRPRPEKAARQAVGRCPAGARERRSGDVAHSFPTRAEQNRGISRERNLDKHRRTSPMCADPPVRTWEPVN